MLNTLRLLTFSRLVKFLTKLMGLCDCWIWEVGVLFHHFLGELWVSNLAFCHPRPKWSIIWFVPKQGLSSFLGVGFEIQENRPYKIGHQYPLMVVCELPLIRFWMLLLSHHGVKQCFHTMDVAANYWATAASSFAGPMSAKSAILMKNALSLLPNTLKIWLKMGHGKARERFISHSNYLFFFSPLRCLLLQHTESLKHTSIASRKLKKKKKRQVSREDEVSSKVGFLKFWYLLFLANNNETVILNIETFFCKTVLLPL